MKKILFFVTFIQLFAYSALAADSYFGAELTFTNNEIYNKGIKAGPVVNIPEAVAAQEKLLAEFTKDCLADNTCTVEKIKNGYGAVCYKVTFPGQNGFWVQLSTDPAVVEIQTKASTVAEYQSAKPILDHLFSSAKEIGITPHLGGGGGGHIHMDFASTFGKDAKLFRNFLVDFMNNSELGGSGILGADTSNAPSMALLTEAQKTEFRTIIAEFDAGKLKTARQLAAAINTRVYTSTPSGWPPPVKYQALNLTRMNQKDGAATIEFRAISPQRSPEEFLKETQLFEARVNFLRQQKGLLRVLDLKPMNANQRVSAFRSYVEESGLNWSDYTGLVRSDSMLARPNVTATSLITLESTEENAARRPASCSSFFSRILSFFPRHITP